MEISILQALLIGLWFYVASSGVWFFGCVTYCTLWRPLVSGLAVGLILGNPLQGLLIGASINLIYIGFTAIGNTMPSDPGLAGVIGTALALTSGLEPNAALAIAVPVAMLGTVLYPIRLTIFSYFANISEKEAKKGNVKGIYIWNLLIPQVVLFCVLFTPVFLACLFGPSVINTAVKAIPQWASNGLNVAGGILPALGIAMTLNIIAKKGITAFFFIGFVAAEYLGLTTLVVALIFGAIAYIIVSGKDVSEDMDEENAEEEKRVTLLDKKTVFITWLDWLFFSESGVSYVRLQGISFMQAMSHALKRLYKDKEELGRELGKHAIFYNTEPQLGSPILGITLALEEERFQHKGEADVITPEAINSIKTSLMGPFAGIGDVLNQDILLPITVAFCIGLAQSGNLAAPIILCITNALILVGASYFLFSQGYRFGKDAITRLLGGGLMQKILLAASILGCSVLGAMSAKFVTANCVLSITLVKATAGSKAMTLDFQTGLFDLLLKGLLPLGITLGSYWLLKKGVSMMKMMGILFLLGFILGGIGFLG